MTRAHPTALIAEDEPLLRQALVAQLARVWPELRVVAEARNGRDALRRFESERPDVCFLDIHMPGLTGVEVAHRIGRRAHVVFVTAHDHYAVQAFAEGALDYLVKPVEPARLEDTVARLKERLSASRPTSNTEELIEQLAARLECEAPAEPLRWIRAQVGAAVRLIDTESVDYLRSDAKYTRVAWRDDGGHPVEALVRTPLKDLLDRLDSRHFVQVHRAVVVNLRAVDRVTRTDGDSAEIHLKQRTEVLPVSRAHLHLFRQM